LFVEDVAACKKFYLDVFGLEVIFEDADCRWAGALHGPSRRR
jgi:catechol 2,3-dioxygenase-like lactoylglutathione lyase family enzyme